MNGWHELIAFCGIASFITGVWRIAGCDWAMIVAGCLLMAIALITMVINQRQEIRNAENPEDMVEET